MSEKKVMKHQSIVKSFRNKDLIVKHNLPSIPITNGIDWDYNDNNNKSTYQVYLQSLTIIESLTYIGTVKSDSTLLKSAKTIILDWYKYSKKYSNKYTWNEHAAAARIQNIIYFQDSNHNHKISKYQFNKIIAEHCEFLGQAKYYKENNHGLMMDRALIKTCRFIKDKKLKDTYLDIAILRIKVAIYRDFSKSGLHLENSPEYHILVLNILDVISSDLKKYYNKSLGEDIEELLKRAHIVKKYLIKPDGKYINLGDTGTIKNAEILKEKIYKDFIDYDAGTVIFQFKDYINNKNSSYFTFSCGYKKLTHKHIDDLSFTLFLDGQDILVDSGKYNYNYQDPVRKFITSPLAHNSLIVTEKEYNYLNSYKDQPKLKIVESRVYKHYKMVIGLNKLYKNKALKRYCILTKSNILFILDEINSNCEDEVFQNFNFNEDAVVKKISNRKYEISLNQENYILENLYSDNTLTSTVENGAISSTFSQYSTNNRVLFKQTGKNFKFLTVLCNDNKGEIIDTINFSKDAISYEWKKKRYIIHL